MSRHLVRDIMRTDIAPLSPALPIRSAVARLIDGDAPAAPVVQDDGRLIGILSQRDCFRPALHASYYQEWTGTVADHMATEPVTAEAGDDVMAAAEMFLEHPFRIFPVLGDGRLVGMLERGAVLASLTARG